MPEDTTISTTGTIPPPGEGETPPPAEGETPQTWETWLAAQAEDQRAVITPLVEAHTSGLRNALQSERDQRKGLEKQLRDAAKKLDDGSAAQQTVTDMADQVELANRQSAFYEEAVKAENGVLDLKAAWLIVNSEPEAFLDRRGNVNFALLKERHPALFGTRLRTPSAGAGSGTTTPPTPGKDMNTFIRQAAGRGQ